MGECRASPRGTSTCLPRAASGQIRPMVVGGAACVRVSPRADGPSTRRALWSPRAHSPEPESGESARTPRPSKHITPGQTP